MHTYECDKLSRRMTNHQKKEHLLMERVDSLRYLEDLLEVALFTATGLRPLGMRNLNGMGLEEFYS